jgi:exopolysaccharide biosynthesis polyprenyl glycosylphosphotransferase
LLVSIEAMLRRYRQIRTQVHQLLDACLFSVAFWLAFAIRSDPAIIGWLKLREVGTVFDEFVWLFLILTPSVPFILEAQGFYDRPIICPRRVTVWRLLKGCALVCLVVVLALFAGQKVMPRGVVAIFGTLSFLLVFAKEELLAAYYRSRFGRAQNRRRLVLLGPPAETRAIRDELESRLAEGVEVLRTLDLNATSVGTLVEMLHEYSVNTVIISANHTYFDQVEAFVRACELEGVEAWLVSDFFRTQISRPVFDDLRGRPVLVFRTTPEASWQSLVKNVLDFIGALIALAVLAIPLVIVGLIIKLTSRGPVLFRQKRAGLNGQPFTMYKFRTMVSDAEQRKQELAALNEMSGPVFKVTNDPRVTPIGRFLRRYSVDELPQLLNVLRGDMSLVGPRPLPVDEVKQFSDMAHRRRLSVKPGLTCLWQISGRNNLTDFREWVRLDLEYIDNWSLWLDLKILLRTIPVVLTGAGAR